MPYSSICNGFFHVLAAKGPEAVESRSYYTPGNLALAHKVDELCRKYDATITQVLLGFFLSSDVPMVPLASANNVTQLTEIATAPEIPFDPKDFLF